MLFLSGWIILLAFAVGRLFRSTTAKVPYILMLVAFVPVGFLEIALSFTVSNPSSVSEALIVVFFIALIGSLMFGGLMSVVAMLIRDASLEAKWRFPWFFLLGLGFGVVRMQWMMKETTPSWGAEAIVWQLPVLDAICLGIFGTGMLARSRSDATGHSRLVLPVAALGSIAVGAYLLPLVAFRSHVSLKPLNFIERLGAKRLQNAPTPSGDRARRYLALEGDMSQTPRLIEDVARGRAIAGPRGTVEVLANSFYDPKVRESLYTGFAAEVGQLRANKSTYGEEERLIEQYCAAMAKTKDARAVPLLVKVYESNPNLINFRHAVAPALASIGTPEAAKFARELLLSEPNIDSETAELLARMSDRSVKDAYRRFTDRIRLQKSSQQVRHASAIELGRSGNIDALRLKAQDKFNPGDRGEAIIELIKLKDPQREKLVMANLYEVYTHGRDLRGFSDPFLARSLSDRILKDGRKADRYLCRFVAGWSPPESCDAMVFCLRAFNLKDAGYALCRLAEPSGMKSVMDVVRNAKPGSHVGDLILSMGLSKRPTTVRFLKGMLDKQDVVDSRINGRLTYRADLAAYALNLTELPEALEAVRGWNYRSDERAMAQTAEFLKR